MFNISLFNDFIHLIFRFQILYEFVFSHSNICGSFGVYSTYPRCFIELDKLVRDTEGILTVEEGEGLIDPLSLEKVRFLCACSIERSIPKLINPS